MTVQRYDHWQQLPADYDAFVQQHPGATPYHRVAWLSAMTRAYGLSVQVWVHSTDGRTDGILPLCRIRKPWGSERRVSLPFCDLAGPVATQPGIAEILVKAATGARLMDNHQARSLKLSAMELRQRPAQLPRSEETPPDSLTGTKVSMLLPLPESKELLFEGFRTKLRSQIRKAEKNGLTVSSGRVGSDKAAADLAAFYDIYSRNMHRLGSPVHSRAWFDALAAGYGSDLVLGLVWQGQRAVGAGLVLINGRQAVIPWASTRIESNALAPNMLLYWHLLGMACDRECTLFDFGRSTFGEGTWRFKRQWGAESVPLQWWQWPEPTAAEPVNGQSAGGWQVLRPLLARGWQTLPLPLATAVGARLRRYITL